MDASATWHAGSAQRHRSAPCARPLHCALMALIAAVRAAALVVGGNGDRVGSLSDFDVVFSLPAVLTRVADCAAQTMTLVRIAGYFSSPSCSPSRIRS